LAISFSEEIGNIETEYSLILAKFRTQILKIIIIIKYSFPYLWSQFLFSFFLFFGLCLLVLAFACTFDGWVPVLDFYIQGLL
jgi:hypothetical protein